MSRRKANPTHARGTDGRTLCGLLTSRRRIAGPDLPDVTCGACVAAMGPREDPRQLRLFEVAS